MSTLSTTKVLCFGFPFAFAKLLPVILREFTCMSHYRTLLHYQEKYDKLSKRCGLI